MSWHNKLMGTIRKKRRVFTNETSKEEGIKNKNMASQVNKSNIKKRKNRKNKVEIVFDEVKRRDFLGGFRKRKLERKKKYQEKLSLELKSERKRLKQEARESYKKLVVSHRDIPELENLFTEEYEDEDVTVKVTELSTSEIANRNNWIGENKPHYEAPVSEESEDEISEEVENVPGMEIKQKPKKVKEEKVTKIFKTEKDVKKALKKQATKNVQKSKAFQLKNKMEQQKNKKKSMRQKKERFKVRKQKHKVRGGVRE